jgi:arylsulfatase A-like enzyme
MLLNLCVFGSQSTKTARNHRVYSRRWDALGAAGNRALQTPNLDWLASSGHHFKNNFVTTSICPSSRASIMMGEYSGGGYQQTCRQYHRLIKGIDDLTGSVIDTLQAKNQLAESLIAFTSDNGFLLGEHGLAGKWWGFEESIRTPLILKLPDAMGQSNKKDIQEISLNIDIAPTILDSAGISRPDTMQGQSLLPRMQDRPYAGRKDFLYEHLFKHPRIARTIGLRSEKYKYLRYPDQDQKHEMLFDLQSDPFELENLVNKSQHHRALEALRSRTLELELVNQLPTQG